MPSTKIKGKVQVGDKVELTLTEAVPIRRGDILKVRMGNHRIGPYHACPPESEWGKMILGKGEGSEITLPGDEGSGLNEYPCRITKIIPGEP